MYAAQRCSGGESAQAAEGGRGRQTLGGGGSCMRRRAAVSAVAVVNCEAHSRSGALSAETESFAVTRATIAEMYQSEVRPNTWTVPEPEPEPEPGCSSSSAAGQPACRISSRPTRVAGRPGNYGTSTQPYNTRARRGDDVRANRGRAHDHSRPCGARASLQN